MPSPFPGMDPWLESPSVWRGVHTRLVTIAGEVLQPQLRGMGYFVDIDERIWVEESERHVYPDLAIVAAPRMHARGSAEAAVLEADEPVIVQSLADAEAPERFLQVFAVDGRRLVTQIEFISHSNKNSAEGRALYLQKRQELRAAGVNIMEIDLLRRGQPIVDLSVGALPGLKPWTYLVSIARAGRREREVYPVALRQKLPRTRVPLRPPSPDAVLDLQGVFERVYATGPYPDRIDYQAPPEPPLNDDDAAWADQILSAAGLRPAPPKA